MATKTVRPTLIPPEAYELKGSLDLSKNKQLALVLNIVGTILLVFFGWFFFSILRFIRPDYVNALNLLISDLGDILKVIGVLLAITLVMVLVHEGLHGLVFWLITHHRPSFGFRGYYAFAAAPGWYIPRNPYLLVGLAPFVLITVIGLGLMAVVPYGFIPALLLLISMNAAGAAGDLMVVAWLLGKPAWFLVQDYGDGVCLYGPGESLDRGMES
jgi:hypothetical protein